MLGNWSALWLSARKDIRFSATPLGWSAMFQQSQCQRHKYGRPHGEEGLPRPITGIAISGLLGPHGAAFLGRLKSQCTQAKRTQVEKPSQPKPKLAKPPFKAFQGNGGGRMPTFVFGCQVRVWSLAFSSFFFVSISPPIAFFVSLSPPLLSLCPCPPHSEH